MRRATQVPLEDRSGSADILRTEYVREQTPDRIPGDRFGRRVQPLDPTVAVEDVRRDAHPLERGGHVLGEFRRHGPPLQLASRGHPIHARGRLGLRRPPVRVISIHGPRTRIDAVIFVLIVLLVVLLGVSWPWSGVLIAVAVVLEIGEITLLRSWSRRLERRHGARDADEELIGELATVTAPCRPRGQVRIRGELWEAVCDAGADPGDQVAVEAVEGLTLVVEAPATHAGAAV